MGEEIGFVTSRTLAMRTDMAFGFRVNEVFLRHARPCAGHPRLNRVTARKTWMAGTSPAMTTFSLAHCVGLRTGPCCENTAPPGPGTWWWGGFLGHPSRCPPWNAP